MLVPCATGTDNNVSAVVASCEQFDGQTLTWSEVLPLSLGPRARFNGVRLFGGQILVAGAASASLLAVSPALSSLEAVCTALCDI